MTKTRPKTTKKTDSIAPSVNDPKPDNAGLPTTEQLAMIASMLARNSNMGDFMPSVLTIQALEIWECAKDTIHWADIDGKYRQQEKKRQSADKDLTFFFKPSDKYPVTREDLLKKILPQYQSRKKKLERIGQEYWRATIRDNNRFEKGNFEEPTQGEIEAAYNKWGPFQNHYVAAIMALKFNSWYEEFVKYKRIKSGKSNANKLKERKI